MRDLSAELTSLNADWRALHEAAESEIPIAIQRNRGGERGLDTAWMGAGCILRN